MSTIGECKIQNNIFVCLYFKGILLLVIGYNVLEVRLLGSVEFDRLQYIYA